MLILAIAVTVRRLFESIGLQSLNLSHSKAATLAVKNTCVLWLPAVAKDYSSSYVSGDTSTFA